MWCIEHDYMIASLELSVKVSTMNYDKDGDSLSGLLKLDRDKLLLLQVQVEAHQVAQLNQ